MIDLHFHALAAVDDGPRDLDAAVQLARAALAMGVDTVVATPHVSWDWPGNDAETIHAALLDLHAALNAAALRLRVLPGAEIALLRAFDLNDAELDALTLGGGPWILVEPPHSRGTMAVEPLLTALAERGRRIVLAHVERCPAFVDDERLLARLVDSGMLASVTAGSLAGRFGRDAQRAASRFIAEGLVHNVASDAHDCERRPPGIVRELEDAGLGAHAHWLTDEVPRAIVAGEPLPPAPPWPRAPRRRGLWRR